YHSSKFRRVRSDGTGRRTSTGTGADRPAEGAGGNYEMRRANRAARRGCPLSGHPVVNGSIQPTPTYGNVRPVGCWLTVPRDTRTAPPDVAAIFRWVGGVDGGDVSFV